MATMIEEFFIGLGFSVAQSQLHTFNQAITGAAGGFNKLALAAEDMAAAVAAAFVKISDDMDKLYFQSQRTLASAESLVAFGYAAKQSGVSADTAAASIENLASKLRRMPGLQAMIRNSGINETDPVKIVDALQKKLAHLPMANQLQYADMFGIDEKLYLTLDRQRAFRAEQQQVAGSMGLDLDKAAKAANSLWTELRRVDMVFDSIIQKVVQDVSGRLGQSINHMKQLLLDNSAAIIRAIEAVILFIVQGIEFFVKWTTVAIHFFQTIKDWFDRLPEASKNVVEGITAIWVAIKLLRTGLLQMALLNPFTYIIAGLAALLLLFDDYEHYKKNGRKNSLFDWGSMDHIMKDIETGLTSVAEAVKAAWQWWIDMWSDDSESLLTRAKRKIEMWERETGASSREDYPGQRPGTLTQTRANTAADIAGVFKDAGKSREWIAGALANIDAESAFDPNAHNEIGGGHVGIAQWGKARQDAYRKWSGGKELKDADAMEQARWYLHEMATTHQTADRMMTQATTPVDAARANLEYFEVPWIGNETPARKAEIEQAEMANRGPRANYWYTRPQSGAHRWLEGGPTPTIPNKRQPTGGHDMVPGPIPDKGDEPLPNPSILPPQQHPAPEIHLPNFHPAAYFPMDSGGDTVITQTNTYHIKATDPQGTAREVEKMQNHSNRLLMRNTRRTMV